MKNEVVDKKLRIKVGENILSTSIERMNAEFKKLVAENEGAVSQIELDLNGVETIDSQGLNLLIGLYQECKRKQWGFRVVECTETVKWLFTIFKLNDVFGVERVGN